MWFICTPFFIFTLKFSTLAFWQMRRDSWWGVQERQICTLCVNVNTAQWRLGTLMGHFFMCTYRFSLACNHGRCGKSPDIFFFLFSGTNQVIVMHEFLELYRSGRPLLGFSGTEKTRNTLLWHFDKERLWCTSLWISKSHYPRLSNILKTWIISCV